MIQKDITALTNRLMDNMDAEAIQLLVENQPDQAIDETKVWTRWIVNPNFDETYTLGPNPIYKQRGTATLQIFIPKGLYTGPGNDIRDQFNALFRGWRSADKKVVVENLKSTSSTYKRGDQEFHLINATAFWHSNRKTTDQ
ncbi:phage tail terminator-like protein [Sphingomonas sp. R1]|uniref:phage tail terminator-like protein n=1 Tax=Sphingomonas sp. R1 TaxID=399176 RepID=UPI002224F6F2|nr:phage tail terminator-like protein [Sphingomonas sp. R1]UYY77495.1 phage tail terminator-like protein [Sphingomonas sp. R1]